jgi:hypothetical protein
MRHHEHTKRLAEALLADRHRVREPDDRIIPCFACGHMMIYKGRRSDLNGRFCSMDCQDWYDAGNNSIPPNRYSVPLRDYRVIAGPPDLEIGSSYYGGIFGDREDAGMKPTTDGFCIHCAHCAKEFESLGQRCCSPKCERGHRERQENLAVMAEVGIAPAVKRRCANPECGARIPAWRRGRKVSSATRFCSPKCARR